MDDNKSYSKNYFSPKNIIIYLIIAAVVYGAVYFLFLSKKSTSPYGNSTTNQIQTTTQPTNAVSSMTVTLDTQNQSGESGTATLTEENGKTTVKLTINGTPSGIEQPAHIHAGSCAKLGDIVYPLTNVINGESTTILDVGLSTIKSSLPLAVNVHKSNPEIAKYVACGDLQ